MLKIQRVAYALVALLALAGCRVEVYDKLSQRDANEMTALLLLAGIDAKRITQKDGMFAVTVNESDFAQAVTLIDQSGLPKPNFASMTEVLSDDRLIASPSEERARLNYALSQELSRTVSEIEGVVSARVHLATPSNDPLSRSDTKSSASVAIHHRNDFAAAGVVPRIKVLVANAVDGLDYERVSVALFSTSERSASNRSAQLQQQVTDFAEPARLAPQSAPRVVTQARVEPQSGWISPSFAVILAGGLIVLLLVGQALVNAARRPVADSYEEEKPRLRPRR